MVRNFLYLYCFKLVQ